MIYGWQYEQENRTQLAATSWESWKDAVVGLFSSPEEMDPRPWFLRTDQLQQGACAGFALSGSGQFNYHASTGEVKLFSQQFSYTEVQRRDGLIGRDRGSTIDGGEWVAKNIGFLSYDLWPYTGQYTITPPGRSIEEVRTEARSRLIQTTATLRSYEDIFQWLSSGLGCVQIGILWNDSMNAGPIIERYSQNSSGGGHSVLLAGYSKRVDKQGRKYLWLANWWGSKWGNKGWAEVAPQVADSWFDNKYTVVRGHSDLEGSGVKPRPVDWVKESYKRRKF